MKTGATGRHISEAKRRVVIETLLDPKWAGWTDRSIAMRCGVSRLTVSRYRKRLLPKSRALRDADASGERTYRHSRRGTIAKMKIAGMAPGRR
jgi:IS30 family transposase